MNHSGCLTSKEGAVESVASGNGPRSTTPPRRGWQSMHWSGVAKNYARAVEDSSSHMLTWGVLVGVITCVGVCVCLVIRPHAYLYLFFLLFWQLNA